MRVLQVTALLTRVDGAARFVDRSSRALSAAGHHAVVAAGDRATARSYRTVSVPELARGPHADGAAAERVYGLASELRPDVIVLHDGVGGEDVVRALSSEFTVAAFVHVFVCAGAKHFRRLGVHCTHAVGARCLMDWYRGPCGSHASPAIAVRSLAAARRQLKALRGVRRILVGSRFMLDYLAGEGLAPGKISVVDCTCGIGQQSRRQPPNRPSSAVRLLFSGRVVYSKGPQDAVSALLHLPDRFCLTIAGEGWYLPQIRRLSAQLNLDDRVRYTGMLAEDELSREYGAADVLVVPSLWPEPAGLVVPEARAWGLPVVVYDSGGLAEWSERYSDIWVVQRGDVTALARTLRKAGDGSAATSPGPSTVPSFGDTLVSMAGITNRDPL